MTDDKTTIQELQNVIAKFCEERDWDRYHNPKDLAIGIVTEASELLDIFRFKQPEEVMKNPVSRENICDELSDVMYFVLRFAQMNDIDISESLNNKIMKNSIKYPVEKCKGCNKKYNEY